MEFDTTVPSPDAYFAFFRSPALVEHEHAYFSHAQLLLPLSRRTPSSEILKSKPDPRRLPESVTRTSQLDASTARCRSPASRRASTTLMVGGKLRTARRENVRRTVARAERGVFIATGWEIRSRGVLRVVAVSLRMMVRSEFAVLSTASAASWGSPSDASAGGC